MVEILEDNASLDRFLQMYPGTLVVIDFSASWCGPCKRVFPQYQQLAQKYQKVKFFKVDVDESPEISNKFKVRSLPTFVFIKNKSVVDSVKGAQIDLVHKNVEKYM